MYQSGDICPKMPDFRHFSPAQAPTTWKPGLFRAYIHLFWLSVQVLLILVALAFSWLRWLALGAMVWVWWFGDGLVGGGCAPAEAMAQE